MYIGLLFFHSLVRWVLLFLMIASVVKAFTGKNGGVAFTDGDRKRTMFTMIFGHVQLIFGLVLYMVSPTVQAATADMAAAMKDPIQRFWAVEHIMMMVIAIALLTVGNIKSKKALTDAAKFKTVMIWYGITLVLVVATIPWPFRAVGANFGWFY